MDKKIKKKENKEVAKIFKNYMQCFSNNRTKDIIKNEKFYELIKEHKYWDKKPVLKNKKIIDPNIKGNLEENNICKIKKEPIKLPKEYDWVSFDIEKESDLKLIYEFLTNNYVEDEENNFRFDYRPEFLKWALSPPNINNDLYFGIKCIENNELIGFISGIIIKIILENKEIDITEVNFLCVKKNYRNINIAPILIDEVTRRSNVKKIWQGLFTSETILPTPFCQTRYYHRNLNPEKLIKIDFAYKDENLSIKNYVDYYELPEKPLYNFVSLDNKKDIEEITNLLNKNLEKYDVYQKFTKEEVEHYFITKNDIICSYILKNDNNEITDFFSFYNLSSNILNNNEYKSLKAAYSFYYFNNSISLEDLYECQLIIAKNKGFDVFNSLDLMDNKNIFDDLLFTKGSGFINYYWYNWKLNQGIIMPNKLGIILF